MEVLSLPVSSQTRTSILGPHRPQASLILSASPPSVTNQEALRLHRLWINTALVLLSACDEGKGTLADVPPKAESMRRSPGETHICGF